MKIKNTPIVNICRIELYRNEDDEEPMIIIDSWEIYEWITRLKKDFRSRIEIVYEEVDQGFVVRVYEEVKTKEQLFKEAMEKAKTILIHRSNMIGRRETDEEGWEGMAL